MLWTVLFNVSFSITAKELLTWRVIDWPPFYILYGKDKGQGIYDKLISIMIEALPQYEHRTMVMNTKRVVAELNNGSHVCHPSALSDTNAALSKVNSFLLPHRIIYDVYDKPNLAKLQSVSLDALLSDEKLTVGIANDRYTNTLNQILTKHKGQPNLINQNNYNSLIRMFFTKRVDTLIEYPPVITYSKRILNETMHNSSVAIEELSHTKYLAVHFACPANDWGKKVINEINQILRNEVNERGYLDFRLRWYDEESRELLKGYYQEHYLIDKQ